jgi:DNA-directed RNA polymerase specialized sigma24 family protein
VVQSTLAEALEKWDQFRGQGEEQLKGWLRQMLLHNIGDAVRHFRQQKCDVLLEQPLEQSSARVLTSLAAEQSSPSHNASKFALGVPVQVATLAPFVLSDGGFRKTVYGFSL